MIDSNFHDDNFNWPQEDDFPKINLGKLLSPSLIVICLLIVSAAFLTFKKNESQNSASKASGFRPTPEILNLKDNNIQENRTQIKACFIAFRYDEEDGSINEPLKAEAETAILEVKSRLENGTQPEDIYRQFAGGNLTNDEKKRVQRYWMDRKNFQGELPSPEYPYAKFRVEDTINLCYDSQNSKGEVSEFFFQSNPQIITEYNRLRTNQVSNLITINQRIGDSQTRDYGYLILIKK